MTGYEAAAANPFEATGSPYAKEEHAAMMMAFVEAIRDDIISVCKAEVSDYCGLTEGEKRIVCLAGISRAQTAIAMMDIEELISA